MMKFIILTIVVAAAFAGKGKDECHKPMKGLRNCLKKGFTPTLLSEGDLEDCNVKQKEMSGGKKKCLNHESDYKTLNCPPLCKEPEPEPEVLPPEPEVLPTEPVAPAKPCTKPTRSSCTLHQQYFPGGQLASGYIDNVPSFDDCFNECTALPLCRSFTYISAPVNRCFVKGDNYRPPPQADTNARTSATLELSCLELDCIEDYPFLTYL